MTLTHGRENYGRFVAAAALLIVAVIARPLDAAEWIPSAGDNGGVWVAVSTPESVTILHRGVGDEPGRVYRVAELSAASRPAALAANADRLWIAYAPGEGQPSYTLQSVEWLGAADLARRTVAGEPMIGRYGPRRNEAALPAGVRLVSLAANADGPWALVRVDAGSATRPTTQPASAPGVVYTPRMMRRAPRDLAPATTPQTPPATQTQPTPSGGDQLLRLVNTAWEPLPLPSDWPSGARAWLLALRGDAEFPRLIAVVQKDHDQFLRVYSRRPGEDWAGVEYPLASAEQLTPLAVDGQLVLVQIVEPATLPSDSSAGRGNSVVLTVPRAGGSIAIGSIVGVKPDAAAVGLTTYGQCAAVVQLSTDRKLHYSVMDLQGTLLHDNDPLDASSPTAFDTPGLQVGALFLVGGMLLMFLFWRKDDPAQLAALSKGWVPCDPGRRALAAAIDFAPCLFIGMIVFEVPANEVLQRFFRIDTIAEGVVPRLIVIGIYALYCAISELFTARTLGKALLGVRVFSIDGKPPHIWQVLARNLTKVLEIVAWPLLIMPMIRAHGQRLGDLAAKTIVVSPRTEEDEPGDEP